MAEALTFSAREARANFAEILNQASYGKEPVIITRQGKNIAVVLSFGDYEKYMKLIHQKGDLGNTEVK